MRKKLAELVQAYRQKGWSIQATAKGHLSWRSPGGGITHSGSTPSDWRALKNIESRLKRIEKNEA